MTTSLIFSKVPRRRLTHIGNSEKTDGERVLQNREQYTFNVTLPSRRLNQNLTKGNLPESDQTPLTDGFCNLFKFPLYQLKES